LCGEPTKIIKMSQKVINHKRNFSFVDNKQFYCVLLYSKYNKYGN